MAQYVFPALLTPEGDGYNVSFPDLPSCYTCGNSLVDALVMAEDALSLVLMHMEDTGESIPQPSSAIPCAPGEIGTLVKADTAAYRKRINNRAIKKTLTIPQWLNDEAEKRHINFSSVLQQALINLLQ